MINPAPRAHIISALLHPESYAAQLPRLVTRAGNEQDAEGETPAVWELPDTSILFRGYLEAGRMINVFDWYQTFASTLEARQRQGSEAEDHARAGNFPSDGSVNGRGQIDDEGPTSGGGGDFGDGRWEMEIQARFIRGVHELDFMGFLKHTGRKPEHVARTVFDVSE